jgi:hypothetical protein
VKTDSARDSGKGLPAAKNEMLHSKPKGPPASPCRQRFFSSKSTSSMAECCFTETAVMAGTQS